LIWSCCAELSICSKKGRRRRRRRRKDEVSILLYWDPPPPNPSPQYLRAASQVLGRLPGIKGRGVPLPPYFVVSFLHRSPSWLEKDDLVFLQIK